MIEFGTDEGPTKAQRKLELAFGFSASEKVKQYNTTGIICRFFI